MNSRINHITSGWKNRIPQSSRGLIQLALAALGVVVIVGSLAIAMLTLASMASSESGFAEGLVFIVFGFYALVGFVILGVGLLIPQQYDDGMHFTHRERWLLAYGVIAPIGSVLAIPIGATILPPLPGTVTSALVLGLVGLILSGPLAILVAITMKLRN